MAKAKEGDNRAADVIKTDALQNHILPEKNYAKDKEWLVYAEEADLFNSALFSSGLTIILMK